MSGFYRYTAYKGTFDGVLDYYWSIDRGYFLTNLSIFSHFLLDCSAVLPLNSDSQCMNNAVHHPIRLFAFTLDEGWVWERSRWSRPL